MIESELGRQMRFDSPRIRRLWRADHLCSQIFHRCAHAAFPAGTRDAGRRLRCCGLIVDKYGPSLDPGGLGSDVRVRNRPAQKLTQFKNGGSPIRKLASRAAGTGLALRNRLTAIRLIPLPHRIFADDRKVWWRRRELNPRPRKPAVQSLRV